MKINIREKLRSSLFLKIMLVFILANIAIITVATSLDEILMRRGRFHRARGTKVNYSRYIMNDLGIPPDTLRAKNLADNLGIQIRFESDSLRWVSHEDMIAFSELDIPPHPGTSHMRAGWQKGVGLCVDIREDYGRYLFVLKSDREDLTYAFALYNGIIIVLATLVIIGIYFAMRWLLKPVKELHEGVQQLSAGNLNYEVPDSRRDELGALVTSFNSMTRRIREMLRAREQLLLDVSHELRSPLTRAKVALELIDNGKAKQGISDDIMEMETMITEILESQRLSSEHGAINFQRINLSALVKKVCKDFQEQKPGLKLVSFQNGVFLDADPERTRILFKNVISNAVRYSDTNGSPVEVSLSEKNGEVVVSVQDFGSGIPEQDLPYIFEPFYRVDKSRSKDTGGYGLGMSLSKKIMEAHGGSIEITSKIEQGTTVYLKYLDNHRRK
jgi:signal transduction histidine kinase